jgi:hypothetical protein
LLSLGSIKIGNFRGRGWSTPNPRFQRYILVERKANLPPKEMIYWYVVGGASPDERSEWAKEVVLALLPSRIEKFARQRWLTTNTPVLQCCLLANVHNLLCRTSRRLEYRGPWPCDPFDSPQYFERPVHICQLPRLVRYVLTKRVR